MLQHKGATLQGFDQSADRHHQASPLHTVCNAYMCGSFLPSGRKQCTEQKGMPQ